MCGFKFGEFYYLSEGETLILFRVALDPVQDCTFLLQVRKSHVKPSHMRIPIRWSEVSGVALRS